jgi:hypothetical protein
MHNWMWRIDAARNKQLGKWRLKPIHAATSSGFELQPPRLAQWNTAHCLISFGRFRGCLYPYLFFPTLPPSEAYLRTFLWVIRKIQCFKKTCCCWNKVDWRQCSGESCISHQSLTLLVPYDQADHSLRCLSRLDDFSGCLCSYKQE